MIKRVFVALSILACPLINELHASAPEYEGTIGTQALQDIIDSMSDVWREYANDALGRIVLEARPDFAKQVLPFIATNIEEYDKVAILDTISIVPDVHREQFSKLALILIGEGMAGGDQSNVIAFFFKVKAEDRENFVSMFDRLNVATDPRERAGFVQMFAEMSASDREELFRLNSDPRQFLPAPSAPSIDE